MLLSQMFHITSRSFSESSDALNTPMLKLCGLNKREGERKLERVLGRDVDTYDLS